MRTCADACTSARFQITGALPCRRSCDRASTLTLGTPDAWASDYSRSEQSPRGTFQMYYRIDGDEIEVAMAAATTSWVAMGFRAMSASSGTTSALPPPDTVDSEAEPATGRWISEAEPEAPASESEGAATAVCPQLQAGAKPLAADRDVGRAVNASESAALKKEYQGSSEVEAEPETPASAEAPTASRRLHTAAASLPELQGEAASLTAPEVRVQRRLFEADSEAEPSTSEAETPGDSSAPDLEMAATFGEGACKKLLSGVTPAPHPMDNQDIVLATARPVGGKQYIRVQVLLGPKAPRPLPTAHLAHIMLAHSAVNALGRAFRVHVHARDRVRAPVSKRALVAAMQDMFTPSRSKPMPDAVFGGEDNILDAVGEETADGQTLIKFRRKLETGDASVADYCILEGFLYQVRVLAVGRLGAHNACSHEAVGARTRACASGLDALVGSVPRRPSVQGSKG